MLREALFRASRFFQPWINWTLLFIAAGLVLGNGLLLVTMRHERRQLEREVCAAELRAVKARAPIVRSALHPADPCLALKILSR